MATSKKTTKSTKTATTKTAVAIETTSKSTTTRRKTGSGATSTKTTSTTGTSSSSTTDVAALQARIVTLEKKLQNLVTILHNELKTEMLRGPRGVAQKIEDAGLTE